MPMLDIKKMFEADKVFNPSSYLLDRTVLLYRIGLEEPVPPSAGSKGSFSPNFYHLSQASRLDPGVLVAAFSPLSGSCNYVDKYSFFVNFSNIERVFQVLEKTLIRNRKSSGLLIEKRELSVIRLALGPWIWVQLAKCGSLSANIQNSHLEFCNG
jgi:hypothetical protein